MTHEDDSNVLDTALSRRRFLTGLGLGAAALAAGKYTGIANAAGLIRPAASTTIKLGDKGFTEEYLIADMYQLLLQKHGFNVERHSFGTVALAQAAITHGDIDMYPEYTGTGWLEVLGHKNVVNDPIKLYDDVKSQYKRRFNLVWLDQSPMNDTNAVALRSATAQKYHIHTMSDLAKASSQLTFVGLAECAGRQDCLIGMKSLYGINFKKVITTTSPALNYKALVGGQADVGEVFSTDGQIAHFHLVVPVDNKHLWPPYHVAPVVRNQTLTASPNIRQILNRLAPYITTHAITRLNAAVDIDKKPHMQVARQFLKSKQLI